MTTTTPAELAALSDQDLLAEANLAADLTREAPNSQAEAEASELLGQLLAEISRREDADLHAFRLALGVA